MSVRLCPALLLTCWRSRSYISTQLNHCGQLQHGPGIGPPRLPRACQVADIRGSASRCICPEHWWPPTGQVGRRAAPAAPAFTTSTASNVPMDPTTPSVRCSIGRPMIPFLSVWLGHSRTLCTCTDPNSSWRVSLFTHLVSSLVLEGCGAPFLVSPVLRAHCWHLADLSWSHHRRWWVGEGPGDYEGSGTCTWPPAQQDVHSVDYRAPDCRSLCICSSC